MNEAIEAIEKNIEGAVLRKQEIAHDLAVLKANLFKKQSELSAAILGKQKTEAIESDIASLETRIKGTEAAQDTLSEQINAYRAELKEAKIVAGMEAGEKIHSEAKMEAANIYKRMAELIADVEAMKKKYGEYQAVIRSAGAAQRNSYKISRVEVLFVQRSNLEKLLKSELVKLAEWK